MPIQRTTRFDKAYFALSPSIRAKVDRAILFLDEDWRHPGLRARRLSGYRDILYARIDRNHRITYERRGDLLILRNVGRHDARLPHHCQDYKLLQEKPPVSPPATWLGCDYDDEVFLRYAKDMLSPLTDSGENKDAVHVSQPPLIAVAWCVCRDRVLNPLLGDDLFAIPLTTVEI
ncbi:MAG: hypothetical protein SWK90_05740 [Chloroflexota bacterium]|nr:hypothetical protein [Chloroflexota bacterium]